MSTASIMCAVYLYLSALYKGSIPSWFTRGCVNTNWHTLFLYISAYFVEEWNKKGQRKSSVDLLVCY